MKKVWILAAAFAVSMVGTVQAEEIQAKSLAELLQLVKDGKVVNQRVNEQREREFIADKNRQQQAVRDAKREQANEEARSERLEAQFEKNEQDIAAKQEILAKRLGSLRELFGVLQQVSGDTRGVLEGSIVSAELPGRGEWLRRVCGVDGQEFQTCDYRRNRKAMVRASTRNDRVLQGV